MSENSYVESLEARMLLSVAAVAATHPAAQARHVRVVHSLRHGKATAAENVENSGPEDGQSTGSDPDNLQQGPNGGPDGENVNGGPVNSSTATIPSAAGNRVLVHRPSHRLRLHGSLTGSYSTPSVTADVGREYDFTGSGAVVPLGAANIAAKVTSPGFILAGFATGQVTLTGAHGSVTLSVKGPKEPGFGPLPTRLAFIITGGTGNYAGAKGAGHVRIQVNATARTFTMQLGD